MNSEDKGRLHTAYIHLDAKTEQSQQDDSTMLKINSNLSVEAQEHRVLEYLQTVDKGLNRFEADSLLNVVHLAARINSLKHKGHIFLTIKQTALDQFGRPHPGIARYFYKGQDFESANDEGSDLSMSA